MLFSLILQSLTCLKLSLKNSNGIGATVTFDCVDDLGYKVKGTVDCPNIEYYDLRD